MHNQCCKESTSEMVKRQKVQGLGRVEAHSVVARKIVTHCKMVAKIQIHSDCLGVGAGVGVDGVFLMRWQDCHWLNIWCNIFSCGYVCNEFWSKSFCVTGGMMGRI